MQLDFELTEEDYINYNLYHVKKSPSIKRSILFQRIFGPIVFMIAPFIAVKVSEPPLLFWLFMFGITSIIWITFYPKYANWEIKTRAKKMLQEGNNENMFDKRSLILTEEGIKETSSIANSKINWDKIISLDETDDYIYIYISSISAYIIPKRVFKDKTEQKLFIGELSKQIND